LNDFDAYLEQLLKDWNAPGVGVGIVVDDRPVFAKGYGYRDYEKRLPFTPTTLCPIASNTKLFTAVAAGFVVEDGQLAWDAPVRDAAPSIRFYNDALNNTVTLRDMLAHRTGVTRHDTIWYESDFSRKELFERLQYLEPSETLRQTFLYNNLMYAAVGYLIELHTGKTWEAFVRKRILTLLDMSSTLYTIAEMLKQPDYAVPFTERRDSNELYQLPYYEETGGVAPGGAIISNVQDMSLWLMALMNEGRYLGRQVLPPQVLKATLEPAMALPNVLARQKDFGSSSIERMEWGGRSAPTEGICSRATGETYAASILRFRTFLLTASGSLSLSSATTAPSSATSLGMPSTSACCVWS
jgi:CubicO group peptidase (beta-lactamase class C family)